MLKTAFILFLLLASGCKDQYTPKPYGYFRIDFPEKQWVASPDTLPYCFEQSAQAILEADPDKQAEPGWMNLSYPQYNAKLHLSYKEINNDTALNHYLEDCHHLAYTHTIKAESINEKYFKNREIFGYCLAQLIVADTYRLVKEIPLLPLNFSSPIPPVIFCAELYISTSTPIKILWLRSSIIYGKTSSL